MYTHNFLSQLSQDIHQSHYTSTRTQCTTPSITGSPHLFDEVKAFERGDEGKSYDGTSSLHNPNHQNPHFDPQYPPPQNPHMTGLQILHIPHQSDFVQSEYVYSHSKTPLTTHPHIQPVLSSTQPLDLMHFLKSKVADPIVTVPLDMLGLKKSQDNTGQFGLNNSKNDPNTHSSDKPVHVSTPLRHLHQYNPHHPIHSTSSMRQYSHPRSPPALNTPSVDHSLAKDCYKPANPSLYDNLPSDQRLLHLINKNHASLQNIPHTLLDTRVNSFDYDLSDRGDDDVERFYASTPKNNQNRGKSDRFPKGGRRVRFINADNNNASDSSDYYSDHKQYGNGKFHSHSPVKRTKFTAMLPNADEDVVMLGEDGVFSGQTRQKAGYMTNKDRTNELVEFNGDRDDIYAPNRSKSYSLDHFDQSNPPEDGLSPVSDANTDSKLLLAIDNDKRKIYQSHEEAQLRLYRSCFLR